MQKVSLEVSGMTCGHCELALKNAMEDIGARAVKVSAQQGLAEVEYDPDKVTLQAIREEIAQAGFEVM